MKPAAPSVPRLALLLGALSMFGPFAIDTLFPAFPDLQRDFAASPVAIQQSITAYLVAYALMSVVHGPVSDSLGRKPVILVGALLFALASVGCAMSTTLGELLVFRALQGMTAGAGQIVGRAIIRDCLEGAAAQRLMSLVAMVFSVAPALAPIFGGWVIGFADWPWIFWSLAAFSLLLVLATAVLLPETHPKALRVPLRWRELMRSNLSMLRNRQFVRLGLAGGFNFAAIFIYIASAPAFVLDILQLNAQQFGWFFVPMIAGMSIGAFVSSKLAGRISGERAAQFGFAICGVAVTLNLLYALLATGPSLWAVLPISLNAFGVSIVFPILMMAILDMYPRHRGGASSMQMVVSLAVNSVVAGALAPWASGSALRLAGCAVAVMLVAWLIWRRYLRRAPRTPAPESVDAAISLEASERL